MKKASLSPHLRHKRNLLLQAKRRKNGPWRWKLLSTQGEYPTEDEGEPAFEEEEEEQEPVFEMDEEEEPHGISHPFDTKILAEDTIEQPEFGSTGEAPDLEAMDQDATMAWLESLAAKQGASEEELLTNPDEREEAPPAWVKKYTTELNAEFAEPEAEKQRKPKRLKKVGSNQNLKRNQKRL